MTSLPLIVDIKHIDETTAPQLGTVVTEMVRCSALGAPLAPTFVITPHFFQSLALTNNFLATISDILSLPELLTSDSVQPHLEKLYATIKKYTFPESVQKELITFYHQYLDNTYFHVMASNNQESHVVVKSSFLHGETNLAHTLLLAWAQTLTPSLLEKTKKNVVHHGTPLRRKLVPNLLATLPTIVIQTTPPAISSGIALSFNPLTGSKSHVLIRSQWGELLDDHKKQVTFPDHFIVDVRSSAITERWVNPKLTKITITPYGPETRKVSAQHQDTPSLDDQVILALSLLTQKIKRSSLQHQLLAWKLGPEGLVIEDVQAVDPWQDETATAHQTSSPETASQSLITGKRIIPGLITAPAAVVHTPQDVSRFRTGQILVVKELTAYSQSLLTKAAALVVEKGVLPSGAAAILHKLHLPTITHAHLVTKLIKPGQLITVNATAGSISIPTVRSTEHKTAPTLIKVLAAVGNPKTLSTVEQTSFDQVGLVRGEYTFAKMGTHPYHLVHKKQAALIKKALMETFSQVPTPRFHSTLPLLYRSQALSSNELYQLEHGDTYEQLEPNPFIGFRGAIRALHNFSVLDIEVEALMTQTHTHPLALLLPWVRTPSELVLIQKHLEKHHPGFKAHTNLWLELTTPANLLHLEQYISHNIAGLTLNVKTLFSLMYGLDPDNPDLSSFYPLDVMALKDIMKQVSSVCQKHREQTKQAIHLLLDLEIFHPELVLAATHFGFNGILVKPSYANHTKQLIIESQG